MFVESSLLTVGLHFAKQQDSMHYYHPWFAAMHNANFFTLATRLLWSAGYRQCTSLHHAGKRAEISVSNQVSCFHHCRLRLRLINTRDYRRYSTQEWMPIVPFLTGEKSQMLVGLCSSVPQKAVKHLPCHEFAQPEQKYVFLVYPCEPWRNKSPFTLYWIPFLNKRTGD